QYYKKVKVPDANGDENEKMLKWNIQTLRLDFENHQIRDVPKYDSFICIPNHINYKRVIGTFYNQYHPLPVSIFEDENMNLSQLEGLIPNSINFIKHLFGDQWEFGLDYIKNLLERPTQPLPILCLVSK